MSKNKKDYNFLIGSRFGKLRIISVCRVAYKKYGLPGLDCQCECGNRYVGNLYSITSGLTTSCGCNYRLDLIGQTIGAFKIVERVKGHNTGSYFRCICECGNERLYRGSKLTSGRLKSCGCKAYKVTTKPFRGHPLYDVWKGMKARCYNKNNIGYHMYGGRGVSVCDQWRADFLSFYNWCIENGWGLGMAVDKDSKGDGLLYSPETCLILTHMENSRRTRNTKLNYDKAKDIRESKLTYKQLANKYNVHISTIAIVKSYKSWY